MSLDLYIISKTPRTKLSSGVFIRNNGETKELLSIDEIKAYFPKKDLSHIKIETIETTEIWSGNMTHNLGRMAKEINCGDSYNLYDLLWHPSEHGFSEISVEYIGMILRGYKDVITRPEELKKYNPENGWGSYEILRGFLSSLIKSLINIQPDLGKEEFELISSI